jgi:hypothetical protein
VATKTTKTTSSAKSNKTKSLKSKRYNLSDAKTRMFIIILSFAIIGGGVLVYRSFAATPSWTYNIANKNLIGSNGTTGSSCKATNVVDASKNNNTVIKLTCTNTETAQAASKATIVGASITSTMLNKYYHLCTYIKGTGNIGMWLTMPGLVTNSQTVTTTSAKSEQYNKSCSEAIVATKVGPVVGYVTARYAGTNVNVSSVIFEELPANYGSTASTSTPAPVK